MSSESAPRHDPPSHSDRPVVHKSNLEEFEREGEARPPFILSYREVKLLGIAGVRMPSVRTPGSAHTTNANVLLVPFSRLDSS